MDIVSASAQRSHGGRVDRSQFTIVGEIFNESPAGLTIYGHPDVGGPDREFTFRRDDIRSVQRNIPTPA